MPAPTVRSYRFELYVSGFASRRDLGAEPIELGVVVCRFIIIIIIIIVIVENDGLRRRRRRRWW
jgi:hypothetical protein